METPGRPPNLPGPTPGGGPDAKAVLNLTASRAATVDAADTERRRIERDLHDGAQQRLVSLVMNLGLALGDLGARVSEPASQLLRKRIQPAKEALTELRQLVRDSPWCSRPRAWNA